LGITGFPEALTLALVKLLFPRTVAFLLLLNITVELLARRLLEETNSIEDETAFVCC
jgi:hypothetical protein